MRGLAAESLRFGKWMAILLASDAVVGFGWGLLKGHSVGTSITEAVFITGGATFVGAAATGGGTRGRRADMQAALQSQPELPFFGVLLGLALIAIGVLAAIL